MELALAAAERLRVEDGREIGRLRYTGRGGGVDLFVLPGRRWDWSGWEPIAVGRYRFRAATQDGARLFAWQRGRLTYVLVTRRPGEEARRIAVQAARACSVE